jgi:hypothetical protein
VGPVVVDANTANRRPYKMMENCVSVATALNYRISSKDTNLQMRHWALAVYSRAENVIEVYDDLPNTHVNFVSANTSERTLAAQAFAHRLGADDAVIKSRHFHATVGQQAAELPPNSCGVKLLMQFALVRGYLTTKVQNTTLSRRVIAEWLLKSEVSKLTAYDPAVSFISVLCPAAVAAKKAVDIDEELEVLMGTRQPSNRRERDGDE